MTLLFVNHAETDGQIALGIGNDRIGEGAGNVQAVRLDVVHPVHVLLDLVHRVGEQLAVALLELRIVDGDAAQLGRADGREVGRMREQDTPAGKRKRIV